MTIENECILIENLMDFINIYEKKLSQFDYNYLVTALGILTKFCSTDLEVVDL